MASEEAQRNKLPFEPSRKRQKPTKVKQTSAAESIKKSEKAPAAKDTKPLTKEEIAIPKVVSNRMARRMVVFSGTPTFLGVATFFVSYLVVSNGWYKLPNTAVLLTSMGFFGIGVIGITYGILSASWEENAAGSLLGWQEFKVNWGRMVSSWRESRNKKAEG